MGVTEGRITLRGFPLRWLLCLLLAQPLQAQVPDSVRTYQSTHIDSSKTWYTRTRVDTLLRVDTLSVTLPSVTVGGVAFGAFDLPPDLMGSTYSGTMLHSNYWAQLAKVRAHGGKAIIWIPRNSSRTGPPYLFSVKRATAYLDSLNRDSVAKYTADGTLWGIMVSDDIISGDLWGPKAPYYAQMDSVVGYVKQKFPGLRPLIRGRPSQMRYAWKNKPWAWAQYHSKTGTPEAYVQTEGRLADSLGICVMYGFNWIDGGDGSSKIGDSSGWEMSGPELLHVAQVLLPNTPVFLGWEWRDATAQRLANELQYVSALAARTKAKECR